MWTLIDSPKDLNFKQTQAVSKLCSLDTRLTLSSSQRIEHTMQSDARSNQMAATSRSRRARSTASVVKLPSGLKEDKFTCMNANAATIMHACTRLVGFRPRWHDNTFHAEPPTSGHAKICRSKQMHIEVSATSLSWSRPYTSERPAFEHPDLTGSGTRKR